jgi:hypothetical protein
MGISSGTSQSQRITGSEDLSGSAVTGSEIWIISEITPFIR